MKTAEKKTNVSSFVTLCYLFNVLSYSHLSTNVVSLLVFFSTLARQCSWSFETAHELSTVTGSVLCTREPHGCDVLRVNHRQIS